MHYKNGREAQNGDKVVFLQAYGAPVIGILYDAQPGNDYCNGKIAPINPNDPMPNLKDCLHLDDVLAALEPKQEPVKPAEEPQVAEEPALEAAPVEKPTADEAGGDTTIG